MSSNRSCYVLITAAKNEERYISKTLQSAVEQTVLPAAWVVVSDGSTDGTDEYFRDFAARYDFIHFLRVESPAERDFSRKCFALNTAYRKIRHMEFDFVGILDADVSVPANYYEELLSRFDSHPRLGLAGGVIVERCRGEWQMRHSDDGNYVAGAIQVFRRKCYEDIGTIGSLRLRWGGEDAVANVMARRKGWEVRAFHELHARHHRPTGTADVSIHRARFRGGMHDYFMGYHPLFEAGKCVRRILEPPCLIGSVLRISGYLWPWVTGQKPMVPTDYVQYLRRRQVRRIFGKAVEQEGEWRESA